jgi:hypothetical protein
VVGQGDPDTGLTDAEVKEKDAGLCEETDAKRKAEGLADPVVKAKKPRAAPKPQHPDWRAAADFWQEEFMLANRQAKPTWDPRARKCLDEILHLHGLDEFKRRTPHFKIAVRAQLYGAEALDLGLFRKHFDRWARRPKIVWTLDMIKRAYPGLEPEATLLMMNTPGRNQDGTLEDC